MTIISAGKWIKKWNDAVQCVYTFGNYICGKQNEVQIFIVMALMCWWFVLVCINEHIESIWSICLSACLQCSICEWLYTCCTRKIILILFVWVKAMRIRMYNIQYDSVIVITIKSVTQTTTLKSNVNSATSFDMANKYMVIQYVSLDFVDIILNIIR